jgi:hypothetical protein
MGKPLGINISGGSGNRIEIYQSQCFPVNGALTGVRKNIDDVIAGRCETVFHDLPYALTLQ